MLSFLLQHLWTTLPNLSITAPSLERPSLSSEYFMILKRLCPPLLSYGVSPVSCVPVCSIIDFLHKSSMMPQTFSEQSYDTRHLTFSNVSTQSDRLKLGEGAEGSLVVYQRTLCGNTNCSRKQQQGGETHQRRRFTSCVCWHYTQPPL